jgi:hypothetical protein
MSTRINGGHDGHGRVVSDRKGAQCMQWDQVHGRGDSWVIVANEIAMRSMQDQEMPCRGGPARGDQGAVGLNDPNEARDDEGQGPCNRGSQQRRMHGGTWESRRPQFNMCGTESGAGDAGRWGEHKRSSVGRKPAWVLTVRAACPLNNLKPSAVVDRPYVEVSIVGLEPLEPEPDVEPLISWGGRTRFVEPILPVLSRGHLPQLCGRQKLIMSATQNSLNEEAWNARRLFRVRILKWNEEPVAAVDGFRRQPCRQEDEGNDARKVK